MFSIASAFKKLDAELTDFITCRFKEARKVLVHVQQFLGQNVRFDVGEAW